MIDNVHDHKCLIFLLGVNVQFVSNLTYLYSYILAVVSFACRFYVSKVLLLYLCNKHYVNNLFLDTVLKSFSEETRSSIREYCRHTLNSLPYWMKAGRSSLLSFENIIDIL